MIGAQKAGTTSLAFLLDQHPRITVSRPKEPAFFTRNWDRGLDWYRDCFAGPDDAILLDATPGYSLAPTDMFPADEDKRGSPYEDVPARIHSLRPNARFIYVMREPAARTYSAYWHRVRSGEEKRGFREAISSTSNYLRGSDYYGQLQHFLKYFPLQSFQFHLFEDLTRDPAAATRRCFEFLGAEPVDFPVQIDSARKNKSFQYNLAGRLMATIFPSRGDQNVFLRMAKSAIPGALRPLAESFVTKKIPPCSDDDRQYLIDRFRERNRKLCDLTSCSLARWEAKTKDS